MAKSFFKLNMRRPLKDGTYSVMIGVGYGRDMYIATSISTTPENWNPHSDQPYTGKNAKTVNAVLKSLMTQVQARIMELRETGLFEKLDNKQLKAMLQNIDLKEAPEPEAPRYTVGDMFRMVIGTKHGRTAKIYESTVARLAQYTDIDRITFDDVNRLWLDGFVNSMADVSANTCSLHMRNLRAVNNYAIDCEYTKNYPFRRYRLPKQTTRSRAMSIQTLRNLAALPLGHNAVYRDIFMLTFYLVGINFVDLCGLREVKDGRIEYIRAKTHKHYSIKVEPEAMRLIKSLAGETHLLHMLDHHKDYLSYYRQLRRGLEAVKKAYNEKYPKAPISELTTYWARHTWATMARAVGVSVDDIALALGHGDGHDITHIYIRDELRKIDRANRMVIDYVLGDRRAKPGRAGSFDA